MTRRPATGLDWAVRIVLALVLIVGGILIGGAISGSWGPWRTSGPSTTMTTIDTVPRASGARAMAIAQTGCTAASSVGISDTISLAADSGSVTPLEQAAQTQGDDWSKVTSMETLAGKYIALGSAVRGFVQAYSVTITTGDLSDIENALTAVINSCRTLGFS